ncbi:MAG TPA: hypothetical protein VGG74_02215 [Kofleriaceae bacterium]
MLPIERPLYALERFIGRCLSEAGIWDYRECSDGIGDFGRVFEHAHDNLRLWGRIWELSKQTLHAFWLDVKREGQGDQFAWFLYFDVAEGSAKRQQQALDSHDDAEEIDWRAKIAGEATVEDGRLAIVSDSMRVLIRDMPEPEVTWDRKQRRPRR